MSIGDIFFGEEIEPSAFELQQRAFYANAQEKAVGEESGFTKAIHDILGFRRESSGGFRYITDQERFDALDPVEKDVFTAFKEQSKRLQKAFAGDLPVSEALKLRSEEQFRTLEEERSRRGGVISGTSLADAVGGDTSTIQSIEAKNRTQALLEDTERRNEINSGFSNLTSGAGMLAGLRDKNFSNLADAPKRFVGLGGGTGLLSASNASDLYNANQTNDLYSGIGGILGDVLKTGIASGFPSSGTGSSSGSGLGGLLGRLLSDVKLKENIKPLSDALGNITKLNGMSYDWKDSKIAEEIPGIGIIAQDVEKVYPELVRETNGVKEVSYTLLIPVLIEAIKDLNNKVESLEKEVV